MKRKKIISRRFGGTDKEGRKLVVYARTRAQATAKLRDAGVTGRVRRLAGRCVNGRLEMPPKLSRGPEIDMLGKRV